MGVNPQRVEQRVFERDPLHLQVFQLLVTRPLHILFNPANPVVEPVVFLKHSAELAVLGLEFEDDFPMLREFGEERVMKFHKPDAFLFNCSLPAPGHQTRTSVEPHIQPGTRPSTDRPILACLMAACYGVKVMAFPALVQQLGGYFFEKIKPKIAR
jgi:hypothetical protein